MNNEELQAVLAEAETTMEEMVSQFSELTVEGFDELDDDGKAVIAGIYEHAEEDLSETALGKMFAEAAEEAETNLNEDIITAALQGDILGTTEKFNSAIAERITEKVDALRDEVRSSMFAEDVEIDEADVITFAINEEAEETFTLDQMVHLAENMSDEDIEELSIEEQEFIKAFKQIYEEAGGEQVILVELSNKTLVNYIQKSARDEEKLGNKHKRLQDAKSKNYEVRAELGDNDASMTSHKLDDHISKQMRKTTHKGIKRQMGQRQAIKKLANTGS